MNALIMTSLAMTFATLVAQEGDHKQQGQEMAQTLFLLQAKIPPPSIKPQQVNRKTNWITTTLYTSRPNASCNLKLILASIPLIQIYD